MAQIYITTVSMSQILVQPHEQNAIEITEFGDKTYRLTDTQTFPLDFTH